MKHLYGESKMPLIFSRERDTYAIFIILTTCSRKHPKSTALGTQVFYFIAWCHLHWAAKIANYLQNYQTPSVPQHFSREITCLETQMLPRLTSTAWKALACLTWLQPAVLSSAAKQTGNETKTLPWSSRHQLRCLDGISFTLSGKRMNFVFQKLALSPARQKDR